MMTLAARRVLGTMAVAGAPVTPSGPTLAIDDGFSGAASASLSTRTPDTVGSPAQWSVITSTAGNQLRVNGSGQAVVVADTNSAAYIAHGADIVEMEADCSIGALSADRWAGLTVAHDGAATLVYRGAYTLLLYQTAAGVQEMRLLYSASNAAGASTVASASTSFSTAYAAVKAATTGGKIRGYLNGSLLIDYTATIAAGWRAHGGIAARAVGGSVSPLIDRYRGWV